ncbi:hypothetical protein [Methanolobus psychrotolerans]|nr:hypothetical protein [Methanolobus psychrotolerans]
MSDIPEHIRQKCKYELDRAKPSTILAMENGSEVERQIIADLRRYAGEE